uniref:Uncharacterized protein n=1 Tax=Glossina brevipalpis TaxID=37001 RepID=A0A1A9X3M3_9MUSC
MAIGLALHVATLKKSRSKYRIYTIQQRAAKIETDDGVGDDGDDGDDDDDDDFGCSGPPLPDF